MSINIIMSKAGLKPISINHHISYQLEPSYFFVSSSLILLLLVICFPQLLSYYDRI